MAGVEEILGQHGDFYLRVRAQAETCSIEIKGIFQVINLLDLQPVGH